MREAVVMACMAGGIGNASVTVQASPNPGGRFWGYSQVVEDRAYTSNGYCRIDRNGGLGEVVISFAPRIAVETQEGEQR